MGTKRRGTSPSKSGPGRVRPGGRVSRHRLEKIPIPPIPAFLQGTTRSPVRKQDPIVEPPRDAIVLNAISDEEADLLLGATSPVEPEASSPDPARPDATDSAEAVISDLPADGLTGEEADQLLGLAAGPGISPPDPPAAAARSIPPEATARSGASGAAVLNALVDEIEKDLERDLDRRAPANQPRRYAHTIGCWVTPLADAPHLQSPDVANQKPEEEGSR